ncbi:MAG: DUF1553 domain-containing protein [Pedosphaera sp.]|nr:DUF1553 domain-containing protein [Pedosphaera sp.]
MLLARSICLRLAWAAVLGLSARLSAAEPNAAGVEFFERKVRPLFAENCFSCHGEEKQKSHLRLDSTAAIRAGGEGGSIIVPEQPEKSRLVIAVSYQDEDLKMPPKKRLSVRQVADLTEWVKLGAPMPVDEAVVASTPAKKEFQINDKDRAHWAFQALKKPAVPAVREKQWAVHPIDAFLLAKLEANSLAPNPPATKPELIRRAYYDLTGLPPAPAEVEAFVADSSPRAWEQLIDRLLESPRYGEKWGRHWLDLVRFAESNSYERDGDKPHTWRYRDYVIRSFNADKPYDRFLREQLAGDEFANPDPDALIATGYYRLGIWDDEPADRDLARYDSLDDIVATTGQVFLGLTVDCARCHNHKIDPIPQKDYYRLLSFFQNIHHYRNGGPTDEAPLFASEAEKAAYEKDLREFQKKRDGLQATITQTEELFRARYSKGERVEPADLDELEFSFYRDTWEKLPDFSLIKPEAGGKITSGLFDIGQRTRDTAFGFVFKGVLIVPQEGDYTFFVDSDDGSRLTVDDKPVLVYDGIHVVGTERKATVRLRQGRLPVKLEYFQQVEGLGLDIAWSGPTFSRRPLSSRVESTVEPKRKSAKKEFTKLIQEEGRRTLGTEQFERYQQLKKELQDLKNDPAPANKALVVTESGTNAPETFVLVRGNPNVKGDKVEPGFLEVLNAPPPQIPTPPPGAKSTGRRTALADWMTSPSNQLTARVMANRIWQYHFGRGIVRSPNNFGVQGDRPTHPELLDWLASEFIAQGWRLKPMHRLIMTSSAYRMSSHGRGEALKLDPVNDLFWRFDMRRLTAEEIRDSILAHSSTLNLKMSGPSVFVDIPKEVTAGQSQPGSGWGKSTPDEQARRSIYIKVKRSLITPLLESFDLAETDRSSPVRFNTVQPTQALGMINGDFLNQQAQVLAARLRREAGDDVRQQVRLGLYLVTARPPTETEIKQGVGLIDAIQKENPAAPELALNYFCLMALNLNEMVYLD